MKHYKDIKVMCPDFLEGFQKGDIITITEKIDGANASFRLNEIGDGMLAFSHRETLSKENNLRGFYDYAMTVDIAILKDHPNWIVFGEWLVPHKIKYPNDKYSKFYCFDIYDEENGEWQKHDVVFDFCEKNGILTVPLLYKGAFIDWEHVKSLVGVTKMGGEIGEGVVVKNQTRINNHISNRPSYVKIVIENMKERRTKKEIDPEEIARQEEAMTLTQTIVTYARVDKMLNKFVDEGILQENWGIESMKVIMQNISKRIYEDCVKEASEVVEQVGDDFGKYCSKECASLVKKILAKRNGF